MYVTVENQINIREALDKLDSEQLLEVLERCATNLVQMGESDKVEHWVHEWVGSGHEKYISKYDLHAVTEAADSFGLRLFDSSQREAFAAMLRFVGETHRELGL